MNLILFGFKGCGKTYFGKILSKALQCSFVDTDDCMLQLYAEESGENLTLRTLYQSIGENAFRELEIRAISKLVNIEHSVISLGGGTVLAQENVELLKKLGNFVYLETSLQTIKQRGVDFLVGSLDNLYKERLPVYESIPAYNISTDFLTEEEIVANLCSIFNQEKSSYGI